MPIKSKYKYNLKTLSYERVSLSLKDILVKGLSYVALSVVFAFIFVVALYYTVDTPKERGLKEENKQLLLQHQILSKRLDHMSLVLEDLQLRDDNIYRVIFEAEPIPDHIRQAGRGGINRYAHLEKMENAELVIDVTKKIDKLENQIVVQSKSLDDIYHMAKSKEDMLSSVPAIQPISNRNLSRVASGYGYRIHPIYKTRKMHWGMDFTAPTGTDIYVTGNGVVKSIKKLNKGYGRHVIIDHGFGYETLYAHMSEIKVKVGQEVKRGDIIGFVGNTGTSTAPHLHYEVMKDGRKIDPVNYYVNDLSPSEFMRMLEISSHSSQSFD